MGGTIRSSVAVTVSLALLGSTWFSASGPAWADPGPTTTVAPPAPARAEVLVDVDTGRVLSAQNDHVPMPPGSLTKMLTAMIAVDWLPPDATVPVSATAANVYPDKVGMQAGQIWPLGMALHALLIDSANDAAYALAERISGSLGAFAPTMGYAADQLGMLDHLVLRDPAGLDGTEGFEGGNLISAWDLAIAARDMMANPDLAAIAATKQYFFTAPDGVPTSLANFNEYFLNTYPGAIGVKTGLTDRAGFCVAEEAERGGRRMLAVVLNGENSYQTAAYLLNIGFATKASAETDDPLLPPVRQPYPPPRPPLIRVATISNSASAPDPKDPPAPQSIASSYGLEAGVLGVAICAALFATRRRRHPRSPIGAHSRG